MLLENYRAGVMERLGVGSDVLRAANPRLIHCSITGFGTSGPYSARPSYDNVALALSGMASLMLDPEQPQVCGPTITDNASGMYACYGVLGALYERERTGRGRRVEVNMLEAAISFMPDPFASYTRMGVDNKMLTRVANSHSFAWRCGDGKMLAVQLSSLPKFWQGCCTAFERPDLIEDARFKTRDLRIKNYVELTRLLGETIATKPRDHWMAALEANDVPFAPVHKIDEVYDDPQVRHMQTFYRQTPSGRRRDHRDPSPGADRRRARGDDAAAVARRAHRRHARRPRLQPRTDRQAARRCGGLGVVIPLFAGMNGVCAPVCNSNSQCIRKNETNHEDQYRPYPHHPRRQPDPAGARCRTSCAPSRATSSSIRPRTRNA